MQLWSFMVSEKLMIIRETEENENRSVGHKFDVS
jgi:hypothetical protein